MVTNDASNRATTDTVLGNNNIGNCDGSDIELNVEDDDNGTSLFTLLDNNNNMNW